MSPQRPQTSSRSRPSCQRGEVTTSGRWSGLVTDAKRLGADLHLSFACISIGSPDWLSESLATPACLQWLYLEKPRRVLLDSRAEASP